MYILFVCVLLDDSPASEYYVPTFRNTLFHLHRWCKQEEWPVGDRPGDSSCSHDL